MALERGNYTDIMERGEYSIDPRDLVRHTPPVEFGTVGIIDREAFESHFGPIDQSAIGPVRIERPAAEEIELIAA